MSLCEQVEAALKGGATMVQMREKGLTNDTVQDYLEEARSLRALTERYKVPLIIDDNIKLALLCGADGVHVGQNDMDAGLARQLLGPDKILGVTAKTVEQALKASHRGLTIWAAVPYLAHQPKRCPPYDDGTAAGNLRICKDPGSSHWRYLPG